MNAYHAPRRIVALGLAVALTLVPFSAPAQINCPSNPNAPFVDNRDGYFVNYEEAPNHPMELSWDGKKLYVTNIPDGRVSVFNISTPSNPLLQKEIAVGLGPVTVRRRPEQGGVQQEPGGPFPAPIVSHGDHAIAEPVPVVRQLWVVCMSSNALFIIDEMTLEVVDSIRLPHRPSGLVFNDTGRWAYVTLSDSNQIAKVDANNPHATPTRFTFDSEMPLTTGARIEVEEPRALLLDGSDLYALSFLSGNGTTGKPIDLHDSEIVNQWGFTAGNPEPPDRDVVHFDVSSGTPQGKAALWRMGTLNFDLEQGGPDGDLYVSTLDLTNEEAIAKGEPHYLQNGFAVHAISHAQPSASGTPQSGTTVVDLNDSANHAATLWDGFHCAVPNDILITADNQNAFVACYETQNVALLNLNTDQVTADFKAASSTGFGIRGLALSPSERWLYAYGRGDNTLLVFDTQTLPIGAPKAPSKVIPVGFDITTDRILNGRFHFLNAANSVGGLTTCNTCHMDGDADFLAWNLSDFTGDLQVNPQDVPRRINLSNGTILKGAKVTMSLLGIEETPPYHWRGDRADLEAFNPAFVGLLGGQELNSTEIQEFLDFVFSLSYPPSPHQELDRDYTTNAMTGFDCFSMKLVHTVSKDTDGVAGNMSGQINVSCETCHSMAGASGTLNQINNPVTGLLADDATQLRGLWNKTSQTVDYNLTNPCATPGSEHCANNLSRIPATGWGVANTGFVDTAKAFVGLGVFDLSPTEEDRVVDFLNEFDTGSAPTTAANHQLDGTLPVPLPGTLPTPLQEMVVGATNGHNDLIVRGWISHLGANRPIGMLYDPRAAGGPVFVTDTVDNTGAGCTADATAVPGANGIGPFTLSALDQMVAAGNAALTVIGTPVGSGYRLALDRDMDCLRDGDEATHSTSTSNADTDNDTFPDGYEVRLGSVPTSGASTPTDAVLPNFVTATRAWFNSNVVKARWTTDEETTSRIRVFERAPGSTAETKVFEHDEPQPKRSHSMVGRKLRPGFVYRVELEAADPSGNFRTTSLPLFTTQSHLMDSVHIASTTLTRLSTNPNGTERYRAQFHIVDEDGNNVQNADVFFGLVEWVPGTGTTQVATFTSGLSNASGIASLDFDGVKLYAGAVGVAEVTAQDVTFSTGADTRLYFNSLDGQFGYWGQATVP